MLRHVARPLCSRGRVYLHQRHRRRLAAETPGTMLSLGLLVREDYDYPTHGTIGSTGRFVTTAAPLCEYGVVTVPADAREYLDIEQGEIVYVSARVADEGETLDDTSL